MTTPKPAICALTAGSWIWLLNPGGEAEAISGVEFALLCLFLRSPHQILDRDLISEISRQRIHDVDRWTDGG